MALTACDECGKDVSTRAEACPGCGCPTSSRGRKGGKKTRRRSRYPKISKVRCPRCKRQTVPRYQGGGGDTTGHRRCEHCDGVIRTAGDYAAMLFGLLMFCGVAGAAWAKHQGLLDSYF